MTISYKEEILLGAETGLDKGRFSSIINTTLSSPGSQSIKEYAYLTL